MCWVTIWTPNESSTQATRTLSGQTDRTVQSRIAKTIHKTTQYQEVSALKFKRSPVLYRRHLACILVPQASSLRVSEASCPGILPAFSLFVCCFSIASKNAGETPAVQNAPSAGVYIGWVRANTGEVAKTGRFVGKKYTLARILCSLRASSCKKRGYFVSPCKNIPLRC